MGHNHSHSSSSNNNKREHEAEHDESAEAAHLFAALFGAGQADAGSRITLIGLAANIGLSLLKGLAGVALHSSALVADAAHGLSDLVGDFAVLVCWTVSRKPPSPKFQFGYGKFESLGSLVVSIFLLLGGFGIGSHSFNALRVYIGSRGQETLGPAEVVDPQAAWVALGSVLVKELLYRKTLKVARQEKSNVLEASALHHRSDAFSGLIALAAIVTSAVGLGIADPIGGLLVAAMIASQGFRLALSAVQELLDVSDVGLVEEARKFVESGKGDVAVRNLRAFQSGSYKLILIELEAKTSQVPTWAEVTDREQMLRMELEEWAGPGTEVIISWRIS